MSARAVGLALVLLMTSAAGAVQAQTPSLMPIRMPAEAPPCPANAASMLANKGLERSRAALSRKELTILALGSSSIEGIGASRPDLSFVPLLQMDLRRQFPGVRITVMNRGIGGETARETVDRMAAEIRVAHPDLVIWQLGTNDVLRDRTQEALMADLRRGEAILDAADVDVLLIDPQRLPEAGANLAFRGRNPALASVSSLIGLEASVKNYALQQRFQAMADWSRLPGGGVGPDDLHLNDDGYACWATLTSDGLAAALR